MSFQCKTCGETISVLENYGSTASPKCFACSNAQKCDECGTLTQLSDRISYEGKNVCRNCFGKLSEFKIPENQNGVVRPSPVIQVEKPFVLEKIDTINAYLSANFKIRIATRFIILISAALLLPFAGGLKDLFQLQNGKIDILHSICLLAYTIWFLWLWRVCVRRIIPSSEGIKIVNWLSSRFYEYGQMDDISEIGIPERDIAHQQFSVYKTYLYIHAKSGHVLLKAENVRNYEKLKSIIEFYLKAKIKYVKREKSVLRNIVEHLP